MLRTNVCRAALVAAGVIASAATTPLAADPLTVFKLADEWGTIQPSGPRTGVNGIRFWNAEGSGNGSFASTAPLRFYTADMVAQFDAAFGAGQWEVTNVNIVFSQSNASFTSAGSVKVYLFEADTLAITNGQSDGVPGDFSGLGASLLQYSSGANALDTVLSGGMTDPNVIFGTFTLVDTYLFTSTGSAGDWPLDVLAPKNPDTTYRLVDPESLAIQIASPNYGISTPIVNPARPFRSDTLANFDAYTQRVQTNLDIDPIAAELEAGTQALSFILVPATASTAATYKGNPYNGDYPPRIYVTADAVISPCGTPRQDADQDGDVDVTDFLAFQACFNGPDNPWAGSEAECACLDSDIDGDVDVEDFIQFQSCFNGPDNPAACVP